MSRPWTSGCLRDFEKYANHDFCNALDDLLPQKLIPVAVERSGIPPHQKVHDLTREQRRELVQGLKHFFCGDCRTLPGDGRHRHFRRHKDQ